MPTSRNPIYTMLIQIPFFVTFFISWAPIYAWHITDPNPLPYAPSVKRGFLACHCSYSNGWDINARNTILADLNYLNAEYKNLTDPYGMNMNESAALEYLRPGALEKLKKCFEGHNYGACIAADRQVRNEHKANPDFKPFCSYDTNSMSNVARLKDGAWVTTGKCQIRRVDNSTSQHVLSANDEFDRPGLDFCTCSPNGDSQVRVRQVMYTMLLGAQNGLSQQQAQSEMKACARTFSYSECVNADADLRDKLNITMCRWDYSTKKNTGPDFYGEPDALVTLGACPSSGTPVYLQPVEQDQGTNAVLAKSAPANEGCIAVEYLVGRPLQHRRNLNRQVLCHNGFCATRNHAIYWKGVYTSLGQLCQRKEIFCVSALKLVNNLKISGNPSRIRVDGNLEITPFDIRFPRMLIYAAQMLEDVLELTLISFAVGFVTVCALFLYQRTFEINLDSKSP